MKPAVKRALKWIVGVFSGLVLLVVSVVLLVWSFPSAILTSERISGWVAPSLRFERAKDDPYPNSQILTVQIQKNGFLRRSISVRVAPGCYSFASETPGGTEACIATAHVGVSFRVSRRHIIRLTGLDLIDVHVTRGRFVATKGAPKEETEEPPAKGFRYLRYLDRGFAWGPISVLVDRFDLPESKMKFSAKVDSAEKDFRGTRRSPKLDVEATADSPDFSARFDGQAFQKGDVVTIPEASVTYRTKAKDGAETIRLASELHGEYNLSSGDLDAAYSVVWKNPTPEIESLRADDGSLRMRAEELSSKANLKVLLQGKTPLGRLPIVTVGVTAAMRPADKTGTRPIDFDFEIVAYSFAGISAKSDLAVTLLPRKGKNEIRWRKGELKVEISDFSATARALSKTSWAIPVPFNVFSGPLTFRTEPFRDGSDRTTIPAILTTHLKSTEQAFATETKIEVDVAEKDLGLAGIRISAILKKVQFRLPDYEPLAPTPALARDPRIVRYEKPKPKAPKKPVPNPTEKPETKIAAPTSNRAPIALSIKGAPGSIVLLNRFFEPNLKAGVDLVTDPATETFKGSVGISEPFDLRYLNRTVKFERLEILLRPALEVIARVSMERSGYHIYADLRQRAGKTSIDLGSKPPLSETEIVSLLLYGRPGNSISSEQTRSVGSAQAAMGSEALGLFSFWAFASTPIESVLYDPETQTYSAVVKLPGGVVASIGSSWDNERQLALSKSLGRNWAVSTELIRDAQGVDRGGTLLRWRKNY